MDLLCTGSSAHQSRVEISTGGVPRLRIPFPAANDIPVGSYNFSVLRDSALSIEDSVQVRGQILFLGASDQPALYTAPSAPQLLVLNPENSFSQGVHIGRHFRLAENSSSPHIVTLELGSGSGIAEGGGSAALLHVHGAVSVDAGASLSSSGLSFDSGGAFGSTGFLSPRNGFPEFSLVLLFFLFAGPPFGVVGFTKE